MKIIDKWTKEQLEEIVNTSETMIEVCNKIGYSTCSTSSWKVITEKLEELNIAKPNFSPAIKRTEEEVFCENSQVSQHCLRDRYLKIVPMIECAICKREPIWEDKPLTLRLDHINGVHNDNRLENLRWVCPNCDSQLSTYCGSNQKKIKKKNYCIKCGVEISDTAKYCVKCAHLFQRQVERPSREILKEEIRHFPFTTLASKYGVSDKAIVKWCIAENLPSRKKDINSYSNEEWENI